LNAFPAQMISSDFCLTLIIGSLSALLLKLFIAATHSLSHALAASISLNMKFLLESWLTFFVL